MENWAVQIIIINFFYCTSRQFSIVKGDIMKIDEKILNSIFNSIEESYCYCRFRRQNHNDGVMNIKSF